MGYLTDLINNKKKERNEDMGSQMLSDIKTQKGMRKNILNIINEGNDYKKQINELRNERNKKTPMTTRKIVYNEPHKEKIKEIEEYMKTFNFNNDNDKVNYYDSLHKNKEIKSKIKNAKKNYKEALQYKNILEEHKKKNNNNEFSEVIKLLQKALEKGTHTKVLQNALKYIKKFK